MGIESKKPPGLWRTYWPELTAILIAILFFFLRGYIPEPKQHFATFAWLTSQIAFLGITWKKAAKDQMNEYKHLLDRHNEIPGLIVGISDEECSKFAELRKDQLLEELKLLQNGEISLRSEESIDYQTQLVDKAKSSIFTTHVVYDVTDLDQWLKRNNNFSKLTASMQSCRLKSKSRLFLISDELNLKENLEALKSIAEQNQQMGFEAKALLMPPSTIDGQVDGRGRDVPSFLYVDKKTIVVAEIVQPKPRRWHMKAYSRSACAREPFKTDIEHWLKLFSQPNAKDLSVLIKEVESSIS